MGLIFNLLAAGIAYKVIKKAVSDDETEDTTDVEQDTEEKTESKKYEFNYQSYYKKNDNIYGIDDELIYNLVRDDIYKVVKIYNKQGFEIAVVKNKGKYAEIYNDYVLVGNVKYYTDQDEIYYRNTLNRLCMYFLSDSNKLVFINEFDRPVGIVDIGEDRYSISLEHKSYEKDAVLGILAFEQIKAPKPKKKEEYSKNTSSHTSSSSSDDYDDLYWFTSKKDKEEPKTKEAKKSSFFGGFVRFSDNYDYDYDRYRDDDDDKYDRNDKYDYHDNDDDDDDDYDYPDFDDNDD